MELKECITSRRSIRKFKKEAVDIREIKDIIDNCVYAPSWKNTQVTRYYVVTDPKRREKVTECMADFNQAITAQAPVIVVSVVVKGRSGYNRTGEFDTPKGKGWQMYDCGLSNMLFCLAAREKGLGTVILGVYDEDRMTEVLEIPDAEEITSIIAVGYPDEIPDMPKRKGTDIIVKEI